MRRLFFLLLFSWTTLSLFSQAESKITYIKDTDKFVVSLPNAVTYQLPGKPVFYEWRVNYNGGERYVVDYSDYKAKTLKKPQLLLVRGFANRNKKLEYDTYVVEVKGTLHFLPCGSVENNRLIDSVNTSLRNEYGQMTSRSKDIARELDSLVVKYIKVCEEQCDYHRKQIECLPAIIDSVKVKAKADYKALEQQEFDKWYNALPQSTKKTYAKLSITEAQLSSPNSAAGCDYTFTYINNSKKTIKYLYWEGDFYNAVNDPVYCEIRDYGSFRGKDTGPVEPGESGGGVWDCVIYNWSAEYVKLSSVSIVYMDGTTATIGASDIKRLSTMPSSWDFYTKYGSEYDAVERAARPYIRQLRDSEGDIRTWESRLAYLQGGNFKYSRSYENEEYQEIFDRISKLYKEGVSIEAKLLKFEKTNLLR